MPTVSEIQTQINQRLRYLVRVGLADEVQGGFRRQVGRRIEITFPNAEYVSRALRDVEYGQIYRDLVRERVYNVRMLDGALIQMMYEFSGARIRRHRLAFVPAPHLYDFQSSQDVYLEDEPHGDVVAKDIVPFPLGITYLVAQTVLSSPPN